MLAWTLARIKGQIALFSRNNGALAPARSVVRRQRRASACLLLGQTCSETLWPSGFWPLLLLFFTSSRTIVLLENQTPYRRSFLWLTQPPPVPCVGGCESARVRVRECEYRDGVMRSCIIHVSLAGSSPPSSRLPTAEVSAFKPLAPCCVGHVWWFSLGGELRRLCLGFTRAERGQLSDKLTRTSCVSASLPSARSTSLGQAER
jgi:hypothetical protein